jgi:Zn-dependent oligopeptidase
LRGTTRRGEPLPAELIEKVKAAETFSQGYKTVEAVSAAILDLELHTRPDGVFEPKEFERSMLEKSACPGKLRFATGCRTSITCLAAMATPGCTTAISGPM